MDYFYTLPRFISRDQLTIEGEEFTHLTHVMRKKIRDKITVVDGEGHAYAATIVAISNRSAHCTIETRQDRLHEADVDVTVAVGLLKNASKYDFFVEKVTEIGVNSIVPLLTERTIPRHARTDRWQKLALAAMKQSGRCTLPTVQPVIAFPDFLASGSRADLKLLPTEMTGMPPISEAVARRTWRSVLICIGPEGGFTDHEVGLARDQGFLPVTLGTRRLRTETAAIVSVAAVMT
jgi:16S rRNA (uracil1498-N3)-methyltransferase